VDARCLACFVSILRAYDDSGVFWLLPVKPDEIAAIQRHDRATVLPGKREDLIVRDPAASVASFLRGQHVVAERSQRFRHPTWKVLISIESRHAMPLRLPG
jgi:hypothetical protein